MTYTQNVLYHLFMNSEAQKILDEILKKEPEHLTFEERAFLRARQGYLKKAQLEEYKDVLKTQEQKPTEPSISYPQLLKKAKELGYNGKRVKRGQLEQFINDKQNNPFN